MSADNYTGGGHERQLIREIQNANHSVTQRDMEIIRLKAQISVLESELRVIKTGEEESKLRLLAIYERAELETKDLLERFPKFRDIHQQPCSEREYGAFWSLDILYWISDYCEGLIDEDDE
jgi:hypothetical protein